MKKIIIVAILSILVLTSVLAKKANRYSYNDFYRKFSKVEGREVIGLSGSQIDLGFGDFAYKELKNVTKLRILDVSNSSKKVKSDFKSSIDKIDDMELVMEISKDSDVLQFFIEKEKGNISRLLIVSRRTPCIICIECDINTKELDKFVSHLDGKITYTTKTLK